MIKEKVITMGLQKYFWNCWLSFAYCIHWNQIENLVQLKDSFMSFEGRTIKVVDKFTYKTESIHFLFYLCQTQALFKKVYA